MASNFKFDKGWEKKLIKEATKNLVPETQKFLDNFSSRYSGQPVSKVKPALKRAQPTDLPTWLRRPGTATALTTSAR